MQQDILDEIKEDDCSHTVTIEGRRQRMAPKDDTGKTAGDVDAAKTMMGTAGELNRWDWWSTDKGGTSGARVRRVLGWNGGAWRSKVISVVQSYFR
ncbi:hypothetical protein U1Q18_034846 [Sarracenia purpurea var. burkii]